MCQESGFDKRAAGIARRRRGGDHTPVFLSDIRAAIGDHHSDLSQYELVERCRKMREALEKLRDCDWVITLPDRMDAVRGIAREALGSLGYAGGTGANRGTSWEHGAGGGLARLREELTRKNAEVARLEEEKADAENECLEQARLLGMSGEREAALLARLDSLERQITAVN